MRVQIQLLEPTPQKHLVEEDNWDVLNSNQETFSIFGCSCYLLFAGFSIDLRFNLNNFLKDMEDIF